MGPQDAPPRVRADARRNRERLLAAARDAYADPGAAPPSLEAIARAAGVGIGTLYRHFPTREALVEALYRTELENVCAAADALLVQREPADALRAWMDHYTAFVQAKRGMAAALAALTTTEAVGDTRARLNAAVGALLDAGAGAGTLRGDVSADDVMSSLLGISLATATTGRAEQTARLLDLLHDGLRPHR